MLSLYSQFQSRYPMGSLISELLQIYQEQYIVRAMVQVGGVTLATGLAAAATVEQAEDQARLRALAVMGIQAAPPYESQAQLESEPRPAPARLNPAKSPPAVLPENWEQAQPSSGENYTLLTSNYGDTPKLNLNGLGKEASMEDLRPTPMHRSPSPPPGREPEHLRAEVSNRLSTPEPIDLSDIIAQTSVELKRLGWSEARGRNYLQRTYGKRSRQQLTDEELLDFLHYLQAEPGAEEPSF